MICPKCSYENEGGNFCIKCGARLTETASEEATTSSGTQYAQGQPANGAPNQYLEGAKNISKMYFSYFLEVLKRPYASSVKVGGEHFINAIITIVLYSIIIPLMIFIGLKSLMSGLGIFGLGYSPSFVDVVIKPTFAYIIFLFLVATFTFAAVRMGLVKASYKEVISRFGSFLIPFVAILVIALVMSILRIDLFVFVLLLGFLGTIFLVPPLVIASYKKETRDGIDVVYGSLITYILTFIALAILGDMLFDALKSIFSDVFDLF